MFETYTLAQFEFTETHKTVIFYPVEVLMETYAETHRIEFTGIEKYISPH